MRCHDTMGAMMRCKLFLLHESEHPLAANVHAFIMQVLLNPWACVASFLPMRDLDNSFGDVAIFWLPCRGRPFEPVGEAAFRDIQHLAQDAHFPLPSVMLDEAITIFYGCEKMASAFFRRSRSWRRRAFSLRKRRISCASGWRFPLPTKALSPLSAASVHQRAERPQSDPQGVCSLPLRFSTGLHQAHRFLLQRLVMGVSRCHGFLTSSTSHFFFY